MPDYTDMTDDELIQYCIDSGWKDKDAAGILLWERARPVMLPVVNKFRRTLALMGEEPEDAIQ